MLAQAAKIPEESALMKDGAALLVIRDLMESPWVYQWLLYGAIVLTVLAVLRHVFLVDSTAASAPNAGPTDEAAIRSFRNRAFLLRLSGGWFLFFAVMLLYAGAYFVLFAAPGIQASDDLERLRQRTQQLGAVDQRIQTLNDRRTALENEIARSLRSVWTVDDTLPSDLKFGTLFDFDAGGAGRTAWAVGQVGANLLILSRPPDDTWTRNTNLPADLEGGVLDSVRLSADGRTVVAVGSEDTQDGEKPLILIRSGGGDWRRDAGLPEDLTEGFVYDIHLDSDGQAVLAVGRGTQDATSRPLILVRDENGAWMRDTAVPDDLTRGNLYRLHAGSDDGPTFAVGANSKMASIGL